MSTKPVISTPFLYGDALELAESLCPYHRRGGRLEQSLPMADCLCSELAAAFMAVDGHATEQARKDMQVDALVAVVREMVERGVWDTDELRDKAHTVLADYDRLYPPPEEEWQ